MALAGRAAGASKQRGRLARALSRLDIRDVFILTLFGAIFTLAAQARIEVDLGWHLRTGRLIWETGAIPRGDPFSFTVAGKPWITHEWLSEVIMYPAYAAFGYSGLIVLFAVVITLGWWLVYRQVRADGAGQVYAGLLLALGALTSLSLWGTRPFAFTLLLAPTFALLLRRWQLGDNRALLPLPPLMAVWVNLHGGYIFGLGLFALYLAGWIGARLLNQDEQTGDVRPLVLAALACFLATLANPNTYQILWYPFDTLGSSAMREYLADWPSPDFHELQSLPFAAMLALFFVAAARRGKRASITDILLVLALAGMGLQSVRHTPLFALVTTPVLARWLRGLHDDLRTLAARGGLANLASTGELSARPGTVRLAINWVVLLITLAVVFARLAETVPNDAVLAFQRQHFPVDAARFVEQAAIGGRIYNAYNWGGYLILRWYPERLVFIDSRADVYRDEFIEEYLEAYYVRPGWRQTLDRYAVDYALLEAGGPLQILLLTSGEWRELYRDEVAVLLERTAQPPPGR